MESVSLRIGVMNLQFAVGTTKGYWQYIISSPRYLLPHSIKPLIQASETIESCSIDVVLITELANESFRSNFGSQLETIAQHAKIPYRRYFSGIETAVWSEGNGVLSQYEILGTKLHPLPSGYVPRVMGETRLKVGETEIAVYVAHLALGSRARKKQMAEVLKIVAGETSPFLLGGDFNTRNTGELEDVALALSTHRQSPPSFPSWRPVYHLQALFLSKHFEVRKTSVLQSHPFSDHATLIVEADMKVPTKPL